MHEGLSLSRKSLVRLTDRPDMTIDVYRGRKTITHEHTISSGESTMPVLPLHGKVSPGTQL